MPYHDRAFLNEELDKLIDALVSFSAALEEERDRLLREAKEEAEADQQLKLDFNV